MGFCAKKNVKKGKKGGKKLAIITSIKDSQTYDKRNKKKGKTRRKS